MRLTKTVHSLAPEWDVRPISLADELRKFLEPMVDAGTFIDTGSRNGFADLHPVIGGVEYHIQIKVAVS